MTTTASYTYDLLRPLKFKFRIRLLLQFLAVLFWIGLMAGAVFMFLRLGIHGHDMLAIGIIILVSYGITNMISSCVIFNTQVIGRLTIIGDKLSAGDNSIDLKNAKGIIISNYIRAGQSYLPKRKISDRIEIQMANGMNHVFYAGISPTNVAGPDVRGVFSALRSADPSYSKKIVLLKKYNFDAEEDK